jgi:uncharacterized membrane protein (DUF485 family)
VAGFDHHSSPPSVDDETEEVAARNARRGMILFLIYLVVYVVYVGLNAFKPTVMDAVPLLGVNLAVLYGVGLIVLAMVLALVYAWLCRSTRNGQSTADGQEPSR